MHNKTLVTDHCAQLTGDYMNNHRLYPNVIAEFTEYMSVCEPTPFLDVKIQPTMLRINIPNNAECLARTREFVAKISPRFSSLCFSVLHTGTLIVKQSPPPFRSPWWLRLLIAINILGLLFMYLITFDQLTFL
jgi:hypothetical protein